MTTAIEKAKLSAQMLRATRAVRDKVAVALAAPEEEQLPLVIDALGSAVEAMEALTERLLADVDDAELAAAAERVRS